MGCCCCKHKEESKEPKPEQPPKQRKRRGCCCCKCCCKGRNTVVPADPMDPFDAVLSSLPTKPSELDQASVPAQPKNSAAAPAPAPAAGAGAGAGAGADVGGEAEVKLPPRAPPKPIEPPPKRTEKDGDQEKAVQNLLNNAYPTTLEEHAKAWRATGAKVKITALEPSVMPEGLGDITNVWEVTGGSKMRRRQVINLETLDFPTHLIDNPGKRPYTLRVSELFHPMEKGCQMRLKVKLTGVFKGAAEDQQVLGEYDSGLIKPEIEADHAVAKGSWVTLEHTFTELKGVRYITFEDLSLGACTTNCTVQFCPPSK